MKIATTNKFDILDSTVSSLGTDAFPIVTEKKGGKNFSILKDKDALKKLANLEDSRTHIVVDSTHISAVKFDLKLNGKSYQGVLQNKKNGYEAQKIYEVNDGLLSEADLNQLLQGDENGVYISQYNMNEFLSVLARAPQVDKGESEDYFLELTDEMKSAVIGTSNLIPRLDRNGSPILRDGKPIEERILCINTNTMENFAKALQKNFTTQLALNEFEDEMFRRMSNSETGIPEEEKKELISKVSGLLYSGDFKNLNGKSITSVDLGDLIALENIEKGIVAVPEKPKNKKEANRVMLNYAIKDLGLKIDCKAVNYLIAGRDKNSLPFFYESKKIPLADTSANVNFQEDVKNMTLVLNKKGGNFDEVALNHQKNPAMQYAYLKSVASLFPKAYGENKDNQSALKQALAEATQKAQKAITKINGENSKALKMFKYKNSGQKAMQLAMMEIKGEVVSRLNIDLVKDGSKIIESSNGAAIDYSSIATPGIATAKFVPNNTVQKQTFGEDIAIAINRGYKPESITTFFYKNDSKTLVPEAHFAFPVSQKNYDYIADIVKKFDDMNKDGQIIYKSKDKDGKEVEKSYEINVEKNVEALVKSVNKILFNSDGTESKSAKGIAGAFTSARDDISNALANSDGKENAIKAIKDAIKNSEHLQTIKTLSEINSLSYNAKESIYYSHLNNKIINNHIVGNEKFMDSYPTGEYRVPSNANSDAKSKAGKAVTATLADISFAKELYETLRQGDIDFAKNIFKGLQKSGVYPENMNEEDTKKKQNYLRISAYVRKLAEIMYAKSSGKIGKVGFGANGYTDKALKDLIYSVAKEIVSNGKKMKLKTTTADHYSAIVEKIMEKKAPIFKEISEKINAQVENLRNSSYSGVKNDLSSMFDDIDTEKIASEAKGEVKEEVKEEIREVTPPKEDKKEVVEAATLDAEEEIIEKEDKKEVVEAATLDIEDEIYFNPSDDEGFDDDIDVDFGTNTSLVSNDSAPEIDFGEEAGKDIGEDDFDIDFGETTEKTLDTSSSDLVDAQNPDYINIEFDR